MSVLKKLAIVGNDEHAWSVAARLLVALNGQGVELTIIDDGSPVLPGVLALDSTAHDFHRQLGLSEPALINQVGGCYRFGSNLHPADFDDSLSGAGSRFVLSPTPVGELINRVQFHHYAARLKNSGVDVDFFSHSLPELAARVGAFTHPQPDTALDKLDYCVNVDRLRYIQTLRNAVLQQDVAHLIRAGVRTAERADNGAVERLIFNNGDVVNVDFVIDCEGALGQTDVESWADYLPLNRRLSWVQESTDTTPVASQCHAYADAWLTEHALPGGRSYQLSFSTLAYSDQAAIELAEHYSGAPLPHLSEFIDQPPGCSNTPWRSNVLGVSRAAGDAAHFYFSELHHTHTAIERWLRLFPRKYQDDVVAKQYNRETRQEFGHVRDLHALIWAWSQGRLGQDNNPVSFVLPETLKHRLSLFSGTGRIAFYEGDVLTETQWVNVLIGCGIWPTQSDPLLNRMGQTELEHVLREHRQHVQRVTQQFPQHDALLRGIRQASSKT